MDSVSSSHIDSDLCTDRFKEECGLIGVWNHAEAANLAYLGLYAQQHRGQEGAGVISLDQSKSELFAIHKGEGLVSDLFNAFDFNRLPGSSAIGHVRYTTAGGQALANVQPLFAEIASGPMAIAHNGNLINSDSQRKDLIKKGAIFSSSSDTEIIMHLLARADAKQPLIEKIISALSQVSGAYSLLLLFQDRMLAIRDPRGFRPLALAKLNGSIVAASETCAFDLIGAEYWRDVEPGEIVEISAKNSVKSYFPFERVKATPCIFEFIYFARPDSSVFGQNVYKVRKRLGEILAREHPVQADLVVPVPDSGLTAALGYAQAAQIPIELGLIRNHYVGRTFIEPKQVIRSFGVKVKLNANSEALRDKSIVVVDDSIVRGTTCHKLVQMLRQSGAKEIHLRISSPPTIDPCYYGIDTPQKDELIASHKSTEEIAEFIGVDSLAFLSLEGLYKACQGIKHDFCDACFTGNYPIGTPKRFEARQSELF